MSEDVFAKAVAKWADTHGMVQDHDVFLALTANNFANELYEPDDTGKPRKLLQFIGTDLIRDHYSDSFWIDAMERSLPSGDRNLVH